jgi:hypothetical protein
MADVEMKVDRKDEIRTLITHMCSKFGVEPNCPSPITVACIDGVLRGEPIGFETTIRCTGVMRTLYVCALAACIVQLSPIPLVIVILVKDDNSQTKYVTQFYWAAFGLMMRYACQTNENKKELADVMFTSTGGVKVIITRGRCIPRCQLLFFDCYENLAEFPMPDGNSMEHCVLQEIDRAHSAFLCLRASPFPLALFCEIASRKNRNTASLRGRALQRFRLHPLYDKRLWLLIKRFL